MKLEQIVPQIFADIIEFGCAQFVWQREWNSNRTWWILAAAENILFLEEKQKRNSGRTQYFRQMDCGQCAPTGSLILILIFRIDRIW